jgi:3-hydroxybutyryl-CoA dehydrogenase
MRISLLTNTEQKEELLTGTQDGLAELVWVTAPGALAGVTGTDACIDLLFDGTGERIRLLSQLQTQTIIINAVVNPLNESTRDFIRINGWNTFLKRSVIEASAKDGPLKEKAEQVFSSLGKKTEWLPDLAGFISPRVVASVINEAFFALEEGVSTREEIDIAMKLGTNYPYGPFEWCTKIGVKNIFMLLNQLAKDQERYKPAALLTREASL